MLKPACLILLLIVSLPAAATVYKCKNPQGGTTYSDQPCSTSGSQEVKQIKAPVSGKPQTTASAPASAVAAASAPQSENARVCQELAHNEADIDAELQRLAAEKKTDVNNVMLAGQAKRAKAEIAKLKAQNNCPQ